MITKLKNIPPKDAPLYTYEDYLEDLKKNEDRPESLGFVYFSSLTSTIDSINTDDISFYSTDKPGERQAFYRKYLSELEKKMGSYANLAVYSYLIRHDGAIDQWPVPFINRRVVFSEEKYSHVIKMGFSLIFDYFRPYNNGAVKVATHKRNMHGVIHTAEYLRAKKEEEEYYASAASWNGKINKEKRTIKSYSKWLFLLYYIFISALILLISGIGGQTNNVFTWISANLTDKIASASGIVDLVLHVGGSLAALGVFLLSGVTLILESLIHTQKIVTIIIGLIILLIVGKIIIGKLAKIKVHKGHIREYKTHLSAESVEFNKGKRERKEAYQQDEEFNKERIPLEKLFINAWYEAVKKHPQYAGHLLSYEDCIHTKYIQAEAIELGRPKYRDTVSEEIPMTKEQLRDELHKLKQEVWRNPPRVLYGAIGTYEWVESSYSKHLYKDHHSGKTCELTFSSFRTVKNNGKEGTAYVKTFDMNKELEGFKGDGYEYETVSWYS